RCLWECPASAPGRSQRCRERSARCAGKPRCRESSSCLSFLAVLDHGGAIEVGEDGAGGITLGKRRNPRRLNEWPGGQMHDHRRDELLPEDEGRQVTHDAVRSLPGEPGQEPVEDLGKVMLFDETANVTV